MKDFLDYISEITIKKPPILKIDRFSRINVFMEGSYLDTLYKKYSYRIALIVNPEYKLIGSTASFFKGTTIIYEKLLGYRFI